MASISLLEEAECGRKLWLQVIHAINRQLSSMVLPRRKRIVATNWGLARKSGKQQDQQA